MNTQFGKDLTTGSIPKHLIQFALPILIGNLVSTGYSVINTIWVGKLLGKDAVAAIAVSFPIFLAMVALCSGATLATSILVSNAYGAKDNAMIQRIANSSWAVAIVMILIVTLGGLLLSENILRMIGTPKDIMQLATGYLKISFLSFAGLYISYLISSLLRGIGDTFIPLIFIIISTVINAVLDPLLIMGVGSIPRLGLNGAAYASFISSGAATIMGFIYVKYKYKKEPINPTGLLFERKTIMEILKIGLPSFIQQMLVSMGYAFMTIFVIRFSADSIAAFGIASRIDSIVAMPAIAMMMAVSTLTAQNIGAGKSERIKGIFKWGIVINIPVIAAISLLCVTFPGTIMRIFVDDVDVIQTGIEYLRIVGVGYLFMIIFYVSNGVITGAGKAISIMVITFISLCVVRIPLAGLLSHTSMGIHGIWFAIVISFAVTTINSLWYYFSGRWKNGVSMNDEMSS
ncbi:putative MATE family efflux protein [Paenibacillus endophyticus]|uniref:Probable multidrug resistance protein NorM n=1 Tax=Paenibacillus endophyticus TaxID=1294268 RepID=A0A7W5CD40_9BACL|nr:MATE family efflux transporter [Paenibacillus endophyticus]MBB3155407.1 putative MATE family efflux protein [Paenibacillus endophyticus]